MYGGTTRFLDCGGKPSEQSAGKDPCGDLETVQPRDDGVGNGMNWRRLAIVLELDDSRRIVRKVSTSHHSFVHFPAGLTHTKHYTA
jgi:hypothetical protein